MKPNRWQLEHDLQEILKRNVHDFESLNGARIFLTGGTGFIGKWLVESLCYAKSKLDLDISLTIFTRNSQDFLLKLPHLKNKSFIDYIEGDICNLNDLSGEYTHLIHAATEASADMNDNNPRQMFNTIVTGTQRVLDFAKDKSIERILFLSSGAVYGQQPIEIERISEDWNGSLNCNNALNTYAEAKRGAEMLCAIYVKQFRLNISIARIFALLGPYQSLDIHFAAGNFIRDAIKGNPIIVKGNGLPCRSYLYISDLIVCLWRMLLYAKSGKAYNVGSDESISIRELASLTSKILSDGKYIILNEKDKGWNLGCYVPNTDMINKELSLTRVISLKDAILRTAYWNGWRET
jgi:nucleoside-diphosphate-sugar epimerase